MFDTAAVAAKSSASPPTLARMSRSACIRSLALSAARRRDMGRGYAATSRQAEDVRLPWSATAYAQSPIDRQGQPLRDTGVATYWPQAGFQNGPGKRLAGLALRPEEVVVVRLPVTTAGCWMPAHGYTVLFTFWVRVKFLHWTHLVQIWWTSPFDQSEGAIISHEPEPASQGG